jgi:hypothetical protein
MPSNNDERMINLPIDNDGNTIDVYFSTTTDSEGTTASIRFVSAAIDMGIELLPPRSVALLALFLWESVKIPKESLT